MVQQAPFVIVHCLLRRVYLEEQIGKPEHVVHVAGFGGLGAQAHAQLVGPAEILVVGVPPRNVAVVVHHPVPEKGGCLVIGAVAGRQETLREPYEFWELCIPVQPGQGIAARSQGLQYGLVVKPPGQLQVADIARIGIEVYQNLVHPPVFAIQDLLHLVVVQACQDGPDPVCKPAGDFQGLGVTPQPIGVAQPGQHLVVGVKGRPDAVQVEALGTDVAPCHFFFKYGLAVVESPQVPIPVGLLAGRQLGNDLVRPTLEFRIAGTPVQQVTGREVVPEAVPGQGLPLPSPVGLRPRLQPCLRAEAGKQAVGLIGQYRLYVELPGMPEGAVEQAYLLEIKCL